MPAKSRTKSTTSKKMVASRAARGSARSDPPSHRAGGPIKVQSSCVIRDTGATKAETKAAGATKAETKAAGAIKPKSTTAGKAKIKARAAKA